jgi:amino acid adenylation domain-containing protein
MHRDNASARPSVSGTLHDPTEGLAFPSPQLQDPPNAVEQPVELLIRNLNNLGVQLSLDGHVLRYRAPTNTLSAEMKAQIKKYKSAIIAHLRLVDNPNRCTIAPDFDARHHPFPLTDLQEAYCVGETDLYPLSTPALVYYEFDVPSIEVDRLDWALGKIIQRHDMLRVRLQADGKQVCPPAQKREKELGYVDLSQLSLDEAEAQIKARRSSFGRHVPVLSDGVRLDCFVHRLACSYRVHLTFRLFCVDAHSIGTVLDDLVRVYQGAFYSKNEHRLQFRDYVMDLTRCKQGANYSRSLEHWSRLAAELFPAPQLPLTPGATPPQASRFGQLRYRLSPALWKRFRTWALGRRLSLSVALCTVYAEVLSRWSGGHPFSLTMMVGRRPADPAWQDVVGNFASTLLLQVDLDECASFVDRVKRLQTFVHESLEHADVSAIEVLRIRRRVLNDSAQQAIPIVFASSLETEPSETKPRGYVGAGWKLVTRKLHTPQVCLDHQVWSEGDTLVCNWDFVEGIFPEGMIQEMFSTYCLNLEALASEESAWSGTRGWELLDNQLVSRAAANTTARALPKGLLHDFFSVTCQCYAQRSAIIASDRTVTYADAERITRQLSAALRNQGLRRGELVAICTRKSWQQAIAAFSIVRAGGAYLPIDPELPPERARLLLERSGARRIVTDDASFAFALALGAEVNNINALLAEEAQPHLEPHSVDSESLAYVIFTSGSTGIPKGVAIPHRAAVNTIQDVLQRFSIGHTDRILALSSLSFDLSVFDIFGSLSCGASLVIPPYSTSPDPDTWARCIEEHGVTIWNSVPALLELMIEFLGERAPSVINHLRLVMLSGDWIPLDLVRRLRSISPSLLIVALGGATEAGIWSNYFVIEQLDRKWSSVPYGAPLSNQRLHILDHRFRESPNWVPNELYIAGEGLAQGYYRDQTRTNDSFVTHPTTGERLYKTGDLARYWPDGTIEFLGRRDNQVKIGGFRIELGEIEAVLQSYPGVRQAACVVHGRESTERHLVAFVAPMNGEELNSEKLRAYAASQLPSYMVPRSALVVEQMPLTANGKLDRRRLHDIYVSRPDVPRWSEDASDEIEGQLATLWRDLCGRPVHSNDAEFFLIGGTSLLAVRLVAAIREQFGVEIPLGSLFANATLRRQAALIREKLQTNERANDQSTAVCPLLRIRDGAIPLILIHPVGGNLLCYRQLIESIAPEIAIIGIQAVIRDGQLTTTIPDLAAEYATELLRLPLDRRPHIAGWSMGGIIALELVHQLSKNGSPPASLALIDSYQRASKTGSQYDRSTAARGFLSDLLGGAPLPVNLGEFDGVNGEQLSSELLHLVAGKHLSDHLKAVDLSTSFRVYKRNYEALLAYEPAPICRNALLVNATKRCAFAGLEPISVDERGAKQLSVNADHYSIMSGEAVKAVGRHLSAHIISHELPRTAPDGMLPRCAD